MRLKFSEVVKVFVALIKLAFEDDDSATTITDGEVVAALAEAYR